MSVQGFDEFMNVVMAEAEEVPIKKESAAQRKTLGELASPTVLVVAG